MINKLKVTALRLFQTRDELTFRNIRGSLWPVFLIFPLSVIMGDLRYFDLGITMAGFESYELMLYPLGLGWLVLAFTPKNHVLPLLRAAAMICAVLLPLQIFTPSPIGQLAFFMGFQFLNGICAAAAFYLFCFVLNNVERLFGMIIIQFYYGFYYTIWRAFPAVQELGITWVAAVVMVAYIVVVFACRMPREETSTCSDGKESGVPFVIGLAVVYYMIMCMINYIEWMEESVSSLAFGIGSFASIALIIFIQVLSNRNALYIWLLFLALSLLGLGILIYDSHKTMLLGSFAYGLGDGLGYIIIYYICAGTIKQSKSLKMFRLFCFIMFASYFIISGIFSQAFTNYAGPNHFLAFGVVLVLCSVCFILVPLMQKKLFEVNWTDGQHLRDMAEYSDSLSEIKKIDKKNELNLTDREQEMFTLLLSDTSPKEIAYNLMISYNTVNFHIKNLYRKLGIQSRTELFSKFSPTSGQIPPSP
ncbi:MAG: LuxR family transcriptional regulator [Spirochaetaceae bacterium]|nr:LuxR family transcriptional regulator [Spirochaetaceae bacterium]